MKCIPGCFITFIASPPHHNYLLKTVIISKQLLVNLRIDQVWFKEIHYENTKMVFSACKAALNLL